MTVTLPISSCNFVQRLPSSNISPAPAMSSRGTSLEEARASGRFVERIVSGITYTHAGNSGYWVDGHEWATRATVMDRTEGRKTCLTIRPWLVAQCYWWGIFPPNMPIDRSVTTADLSTRLHSRMIQGGVISNLPFCWTDQLMVKSGSGVASQRCLGAIEESMESEVCL